MFWTLLHLLGAFNRTTQKHCACRRERARFVAFNATPASARPGAVQQAQWTRADCAEESETIASRSR